MLLLKCLLVCNSEKSKFLKEQEVRRLLSRPSNNNTFKSNSFASSSFVLKVWNEWNNQQISISKK